MNNKNIEAQTKTNKKLKVAWLCYFTNGIVQNNIKPFRRVGEIAPWISKTLRLFEDKDDIELHIVSQHEWISGYKKFKYKGVFYHFINKGIPVIGRHWPAILPFDYWSDDYFFKKRIKSIINKINPDIIHLHGAENEFSAAIMQFYNKYPVFITVQGFIHKSFTKSKRVKRRIERELEIFNTFNHYGYRTETMGRDIKSLNPDALLHWHRYPNKVIRLQNSIKKFDLVFFARFSKDKGIVDLLKAVSIIKKEKPGIRLCAIGGGKTDDLKALAAKLDISENVHWAGFLSTQDDLHKLASQARISVLPTYHDTIPGTIIESLFLKLPVVAYNAGSIHEVNKNEEIISLVEIADIQSLAKAILKILNNEKLQQEKAEKGYQRAVEMFSTNHNKIRQDILEAYKEVILDFKMNK